MFETTHVQRRKDEVVNQFGEWTAHNIQLAEGLYTIGEDSIQRRLLRVIQNVADVVGCPLSELRVLDLGCLEGQYAIEFARHGATAVGVDGREANLEKARFAKEMLGLDRVTLMQDDVRNLSREKHGSFDVVLCLGLLYHLDSPDVFQLVENMFDVCQRCVVIDTSFNLSAKQSFSYKGRTYWGCAYQEHEANATDEQKEENLWGSLDNLASVWLTKPSLLNLLADVGFTSVFECHNPSEIGKLNDRITLIAIKGTPHEIRSQPIVNERPRHEAWPEHRPFRVDAMQTSTYAISKAITGMVPRAVKVPLKRLLRAARLMRPARQPWEWEEPWKRKETHAAASSPVAALPNQSKHS